MTTTKSLFVAMLLSGVAALSFAQTADSGIGKTTPSASVTKAVHHKKHHYHHHHAHHSAAAAATPVVK